MGTLVAVAVVTVGCSSGAEPRGGNSPSDPSSTPATSPSDSASASPTGPPPLPDAAKGTSKKAAKAFVRHWIATLNYAGPAGDTKQLRRLTSKRCIQCQAIEDFIDKTWRNGGSIRGRGWAPLKIRFVDRENGVILIDAFVRVRPQRVRKASDGRLVQFDGGKRLKEFHVANEGDRWKVIELEQPG